MKTLETIMGIIKSGFVLPKTTTTTKKIVPKIIERVGYTQHGGTITTQEAGDFPNGPVWYSYSGWRDYTSPSGVYLFTEKLPVYERTNVGWGYTNSLGWYINKERSIPAKKEIEITEKEVSGKLCWIPYSFTKSEFEISSTDIVYSGHPGNTYRRSREIPGRID
jgi:hypothetical protein